VTCRSEVIRHRITVDVHGGANVGVTHQLFHMETGLL